MNEKTIVTETREIETVAPENPAAPELENALERVEAAEAVAQAVTDAALQTKLGRQVESVRVEIEKCLAETSTTKAEISQVREILTALESRIAEMTARSPVVVSLPIPAASEGMQEALPLTVVAINPADQSGEQSALIASAAAPSRPVRRML